MQLISQVSSSFSKKNAQMNILNHLRKTRCKDHHFILKKFSTYNIRKQIIIVLYSWLFMNSHPIETQRVLSTMVASRLIGRALNRPSRANQNTGGMSTLEAIALIQAINSGNRDTHQITDLLSDKSALNLGQRGILNRQLPVPVPVPVPVPNPITPITPFPPFPPQPPAALPFAIISAAAAAFFAAVIAGLAPFAALFSAFFAALIVFLAAILNINPNKGNKANPLIKKLIIKKTVLPFVIPIPYKAKGKEKEIVYKYIHKPQHHHKKEKEHEYVYKKLDVEPVKSIKKKEVDSLSKIEKLVDEQDKIQKMLNKFIEKDGVESRLGKESIQRTRRSVSAIYGS